MREIRKLFETYNAKTTLSHEKNTAALRRGLIKKLEAMRTFNDKQQFIDNKIIYDQRFFSNNYEEFELMISDIRKQVRLNEEVFRLRRCLREQL